MASTLRKRVCEGWQPQGFSMGSALPLSRSCSRGGGAGCFSIPVGAPGAAEGPLQASTAAATPEALCLSRAAVHPPRPCAPIGRSPAWEGGKRGEWAEAA